MRKVRIALHWQMSIALLAGVANGLLWRDSYNLWGGIVCGIGQMFLHAINMMVIPLVFLSTVLSVSTINSPKTLGKVAVKTFAFFLETALLAAIIAVMLADVLRPGYGTASPAVDNLNSAMLFGKVDEVSSMTWIDRLVAIVPQNIFEAFASGEMLPIIIFSLMIGFFTAKIKTEKKNDVNELLDSFQEVIMKMTSFVIGLMPIGVFAIVMTLVGKNVEIVSELFGSVAIFVFVVWMALIVMGGIILPVMVGLGAKTSPFKHIKQIYSALLVAFSTSSSYGALPMIMSDTKEKVGVSDEVTSFTVPLGITFNKVGTIIYECVAVVFVSQAIGIEMTTVQQMELIGASIVMVLGVPSVPMAGVLVLTILLKTMGFSDAYIGMFMAVDILCDMPKTLLNAYSISCIAVIVAKSEGETLKI